ncbi:hypothetical protein [Niallia sp.]|uniref:antibiotic biosynthesis monooxygenase family protein n=1 Tax=Niallia sp. TaxID=2837523 RepID=UPI0028A09A4B|nr:hypothetical protein [Niallia sp.]
MNIYLTSGTYDYLWKKYEDEFSKETLLLMQDINSDRAILLHESQAPSFFKEPRSYDVLFTHGMLENKGFITMNHIPVSEENKPVFEHNMSKFFASNTITNLQATRFLRPRKGDTYIIFCLWEEKANYIKWKQHPENANAPIGKTSEKSWNSSQHSIFNGKPYFVQLTIPDEKES